MKFIPLPLDGAFLIEQERHHDERGYFARTFCVREYAEHGLITTYVQCSTSHNLRKGQIRGMHYQEDPHGETKLVRCTKGAIFDVIVDLRPHSPTFRQWHGETLSQENGRQLYIPRGFAHGFKCLEDESDVYYMMDTFYVPEAAREIASAPYFKDVKDD